MELAIEADVYARSGQVFKALAHPLRLQILDAIRGRGACVCELAAQLRLRQPYVSQQLAVLRAAHLVCSTKRGLWVRYRLCDDRVTRLLEAATALGGASRLAEHKAFETGLLQEIKKMSNNNGNMQWHNVPRSEIGWAPTVMADRCIGCGLCVTSCGRDVYSFDYAKKLPVVTAPQMCMVGCTTCATTCTQDAIEFPSEGYIRFLIKRQKVLRKVKDELETDRAKYDLALKGKALA
jgi:DNA-binding transcriptional ArsR family regulator/NAD-dependent dihydropyrimidine dehydrogenase PreA subunit